MLFTHTYGQSVPCVNGVCMLDHENEELLLQKWCLVKTFLCLCMNWKEDPMIVRYI